MNFPITNLTSLPTHHHRSFSRTPPVSGGTNRGSADVDKLETLNDGGCPTDLKGTWTDVEENLNACEKGSHDQS
jgi:hypothetical protein